jgi:alkylation response protein AidB-like acyl-CoA dehydrogenase
MDEGVPVVKWVFTAEQEQFRREVRSFLEDYAQQLSPRQFFLGRGGAARELYRALGARGWLSLCWPTELGGQGRSAAFEFILWDELAAARAARPDLGPGIVAKTLIANGTADQQRRYLPGIQSGEAGFALGYSEPEAGSDLGSVRTQARRDGDVYRVSGEKRWTSDAHNSDYLWLLCRATEEDGSSLGRTLLILDLRAPGVTIRPIRTIDGHQLNEVFLDDVVVPVADRVGEEGQAWQLIREALAVERHLMLMPGRVRRDLVSLLEWAGERGRLSDPVLADRIRGFVLDVHEVEAAAFETLALIEAGEDCTGPAARLKLLGSQACQAIARCAFDLGLATTDDRESDLAFLWRESVMETIAGGTTEIMRGVLARAELDMEVAR